MSNISRHQKGSQVAGKKAGGQFKEHSRDAAAIPRSHAELAKLFPQFSDEAIHSLVKTENKNYIDTALGWLGTQENRKLRGHDFYPPKKVRERIPKLYATDSQSRGGGKVLHAHYFGPTGDFYVAELDPETGEAFGIFKNNFGEAELTYFDLPAAEQELATDRHGMPRIFERDLHFEPGRASELIPEKYGERAADRLSQSDHTALESSVEEYRTLHREIDVRQSISEASSETIIRLATARQQLDRLAESHGIKVLNPLNDGPAHRASITDLRTVNLPEWEDTEVRGLRRAHA